MGIAVIHQPTTYIFKLRGNIALEGDLALASRDLAAFIGPVEPVADLSTLDGFTTFTRHTRPQGVQGYRAEALLAALPDLIQRPAFIQRIYAITEDTRAARALLAEYAAVTTWRADSGSLFIEAVPHYALFELAGIVARRAKHPAQTKTQCTQLLDALTGRDESAQAQRVMDMALSAKQTTGHLTHDIHYYKAKFFPRMARAMLNIARAQTGADQPEVLDPFVGSGTTLLEAALMGMPSQGVDLDPLSVLIARTKLNTLSLDSTLIESEAMQISDRLQAINGGQRSLFASTLDIDFSPIQWPDWLTKNRAMTPAVAAELSDNINALRAAIAPADPVLNDLLRVLLSDAISRHVRMRFLGTGSGRFALTFSKTPLHTLLTRALERCARSVAAWEWLRETLGLSLAPVDVHIGDARKLDTVQPCDVVVTSPPYLPASSGRESYAKARAPSLLALGMADTASLNALVDDAVGSMDKGAALDDSLTDQVRELVAWLQSDSLRAIKADPTARYFHDMRQAFAAMRRVLRPGGVAVVVSGTRSTFYAYRTREVLYTVPAAEMLAEEAICAGLHQHGLIDIQLHKSHLNARPRSRDAYSETLIVLKKS